MESTTKTAVTLPPLAKQKVTLRNGEILSYLEYGQGDKTLILLHGNPGSAAMWDIFIEAMLLKMENLRMLALDMRGTETQRIINRLSP